MADDTHHEGAEHVVVLVHVVVAVHHVLAQVGAPARSQRDAAHVGADVHDLRTNVTKPVSDKSIIRLSYALASIDAANLGC